MKTRKIQPVHKGEKMTISITGLGHSGEGVGRVENYTVFVPGALPDETVAVEMTEVKKSYGKARLLQVLSASSDRIEAPCPIYHECGGCQLQHLDYPVQLEKKRETVVAAITRIGKLDDVVVQSTLGAPQPWHYRNKMQLPFGQRENQVVVGCYEQGTHQIVPLDNCLIQHELNNQIAESFPKIIGELGLTVYDERTRQGIVRYVMGRVGVMTGEGMIVIVTGTDHLPQQKKLAALLTEKIPGVKSIIHNVNKQVTNIMLGSDSSVIWGTDHITDKLGELVFKISAHSFFQVNTLQAKRLYEEVLKEANLTGTETVIDAYCGTGTISLFLARQAKQVYGIEIVAPAIDDARDNARTNGIENVEFIVGDATEVMPKLYAEGITADVVVVDPPRAGCSVTVLETFVQMQPKRMVYVSCNPSSLARDLAFLKERGYETKSIQPVDMFPQTFHVEAVALIQRRIM